MISNCGHDERWRYSGGAAGDNNGTEWQLVNWYSYPWDMVLRYPEEKIRNWMGDQAIAAAKNDNVGYDQGQRQTFWHEYQKAGYDVNEIRSKCETDCSAGVLAIAKAAGYKFNNKKLMNINQNGYTGNEERILSEAGFTVYKDKKYLTSDKNLKHGDILLNTVNHTAFNVDATRKPTEEPAPAVKTEPLGSKGDDYIDVSQHQGTIDWAKVKPYIKGAWIRVGYGSDISEQDDTQAARNIKECERLGIPWGPYLYSYAYTIQMVRSEVDHMKRVVGNSNPTLPWMYDLEERRYGSFAPHAAKAFANLMTNMGKEYLIYCYKFYYKSFLSGVNIEKNRWWIADYGTNNGQALDRFDPRKSVDSKIAGWQYTSVKRLPGITENTVDCNKFFIEFGKPSENTSSESKPAKKSILEVAKDVIGGKYGNDPERSEKLTSEGYNAKEVQDKVNELYNARNAVEYVVKRGDTLIGIASKFGVDYKKIAADNKITNPNRIIVGQKLLIKR